MTGKKKCMQRINHFAQHSITFSPEDVRTGKAVIEKQKETIKETVSSRIIIFFLPLYDTLAFGTLERKTY